MVEFHLSSKIIEPQPSLNPIWKRLVSPGTSLKTSLFPGAVCQRPWVRTFYTAAVTAHFYILGSYLASSK